MSERRQRETPGEYHEQHQARSGLHKKGGHKQGEAAGEHKAKKGHYELKGHKKAGGHEKYGKKEAHSDWKKFGYGKGKGGKGGGDSGGAHSIVRHLLVVPPAPDSSQTFTQTQLPRFLYQGVKEMKQIQSAKTSEALQEGHRASASTSSLSWRVRRKRSFPSTELKPPPY